MASYQINHYYQFSDRIANVIDDYDLISSDSIIYNSNCSWFKIIIGPCDSTNSEDPIIKDYKYSYKPFGNWKLILMYYDAS